MLDAGLLVGLAGCIAVVYCGYRRSSGREGGPPWINRLEAIGELASQAACFAGIAMLQFASVIRHVAEATVPAHLWLSIVSTAVGVLMFGIALGRLLMRWQLWSLRAVLDTKTGELMTKA